MGMQVRLVLYAPTEAEARDAATAAFAEIARLDAVFSDYRPDSELRRLSREAAPRPVSEELFLVLERAVELAERTEGAFDPAAGAITALWRAAIASGRLPEAAAIAAARDRSGYDKVLLARANRVVTLSVADVRLDLGAIAKGFILDRALATLRGAGIEAALVEAGGDIVLGAAPPTHAGWAIDVPHLAGCTLILAGAAVSTSGDSEQFLEVDGVRYSHTVDPRTGIGITEGRTVTVVAADGLTADSLATALTLIDEREGDAVVAAFPPARAVRAPAECLPRRSRSGQEVAARLPMLRIATGTWGAAQHRDHAHGDGPQAHERGGVKRPEAAEQVVDHQRGGVERQHARHVARAEYAHGASATPESTTAPAVAPPESAPRCRPAR